MITLKNMMTTAGCSMSNTWQRITAVLSGVAVHLSTGVDSLTGMAFTALDTILKDLSKGLGNQQPTLQPIRIDDSNNRPHTNS